MRRRGVAMLLVVMTVTVLVTGVSVIAGARTSEGLAMRQAADLILTDDLARAVDAPIRHWLEEESGSVVLPVEIEAPWVAVQDDRVEINGRALRVRISAWDQQGMWPADAGELGLEPPVGELAFGDGLVPGLDAADGGRRVFPSVEHRDAPGGLIATHNPWPTRSGTTRSRAGAVVNVNTAPAELLKAVYARFPAGDLDEVLRRRAAGEMAVVSASAQDGQQRSVRLVGISRVWSVRVDVEVGPQRRSWWMVYANRGGNWAMVQRLVIGHG